MRAGIDIEALHDLDAVTRLEHDWRRLWAAAPSAFTSYDWCVPWFRQYGRRARGRLQVLVAREAGEVIGIAPLYAWRGTLGGWPVRRVDLLGHNFSMPELLVSRHEAAVIPAFLEYLASSRGPRFDALVLRGLQSGTSQLAHTEAWLAEHHYRVHRNSIPTPSIQIEGNFEAYLKARGKNLKQQLSRAAKRCEAVGKVELVTHQKVPPAEAVELLDRVFVLSARSWKGTTGEAIGVQPLVAAFYREVAERFNDRGELMLTMLTIDGQDVAYVFGIAAGKRYYHIDTAYDRALHDASPGTLVNLHLIRELHELGFEQYVNEGYEAYKARWMSSELPTLELMAFRPTARGRLAGLAKLEVEPVARAIDRLRREALEEPTWQGRAEKLLARAKERLPERLRRP